MSKLRYAILPNVVVPLAGASTDIYLPSLPYMAQAFSVDPNFVQLTITSFVLAMAIGQYIAGPVSDALGRRNLIIASLVLQVVAIVGILSTAHMGVVIAIRAVQGMACAFMIVPGRAILNDCFTGIELKKKYNYLTMSFALSPIIAPFIGGYCQHWFGWQASFIFILLYSIILLGVMLLFTEETLQTRRKFSPSHIIRNYKVIMSRPTFLYPTIFLGVVFGYTSLNNVLGPFIFHNLLSLNAVQYGYVALTIGGAWFTGNSLNRILFHHHYLKKVVASLIIQTVMIALMLVLAYFERLNVATFLIPLCVVVACAAMIFSVFVGECLSQFPQLAGSANAFLFATGWLAFGIFTLIATFIPEDRFMPMLVAFLSVNALSYFMLSLPSVRRVDKV